MMVPETDIPLAPTPQNLQPPPVESPPIVLKDHSPKSKKLILGVLAGLVILALVSVVAFGAYQMNKNQTSALTVPPLPVPETANWKTYTNTKYSYQISYPKKWILYPTPSDNTDSINFRLVADETPAETTGFAFIVDPTKNVPLSKICATVQQDFLCYNKNIPVSQENVNGLMWEKIPENYVSLPPTGSILFDLVHSQNLFIVNSYNTNAEDIKKILSTLKFPDQKTAGLGHCVPKFTVETGPELTASANYAQYCYDKTSESECLKVDIFNAATNNFGNSDGVPDCQWSGN